MLAFHVMLVLYPGNGIGKRVCPKYRYLGTGTGAFVDAERLFELQYR